MPRTLSLLAAPAAAAVRALLPLGVVAGIVAAGALASDALPADDPSERAVRRSWDAHRPACSICRDAEPEFDAGLDVDDPAP